MGDTLNSRYVIGTDGGHSTVRKLSGIPFIGTKSGAKWVRMDVSHNGIRYALDNVD